MAKYIKVDDVNKLLNDICDNDTIKVGIEKLKNIPTINKPDEIVLKPCPLCGSKAELKQINGDYDHERVNISCTLCGVCLTVYYATYSYSSGYILDGDYVNKAVRRWNARYSENTEDKNE